MLSGLLNDDTGDLRYSTTSTGNSVASTQTIQQTVSCQAQEIRTGEPTGVSIQPQGEHISVYKLDTRDIRDIRGLIGPIA